MVDLQMIRDSIIEGSEESAIDLVRQAIAEGVAASYLIDGGLIPAMDVIGERMAKHEIFLPEVMVSAEAMHAAMGILKPLLAKEGGASSAAPKVVLGTVKGDVHDIGKNLVGVMLTGGGFEVIDLGTDVSSETFIQTIERENAKILAMSALLTTTAPQMRITIERLEAAGLKEKVRVIVGGAAVSPDYCRQIGAHGYARDAASAVVKVRELVSL